MKEFGELLYQALIQSTDDHSVEFRAKTEKANMSGCDAEER